MLKQRTQLAAFLICVLICTEAYPQNTTAARDLLLRGRYMEAIEQFGELASTADQAIGEAKCLWQTGKLEQAIAKLNQLQEPTDATLGQLARYLFDVGKHAEAKQQTAAALKLNPRNPTALFVGAELDRDPIELHKRISELQIAKLSNEQALWVGRSIANVARRTGDSRAFDDLVNEFYPSLLEREPNFWPAHLEIGVLFLEKFNEPEALRAINRALAINPRSAEIHAAFARLRLLGFDFDEAEKHIAAALQIDAKHQAALVAKCDLALQNRDLDGALAALESASQTNPKNEVTLGRQLAVRAEHDRASAIPNSSKQIEIEFARGSGRKDRFYIAAGDAYDAMRLYEQSLSPYSKAIETAPNNVFALTNRGLALMRLGQEVEAQKDLETAFKLDPFNIRVKNTLEVLDTLQNYAVIETKHFVVRFDRGHDQLLAEYAADYLEETVYPLITKQLDYKPQQKTLLEIFSRSGGTSGHAWFSARMVGMPFIGTVGACAGKMFALTSPGDGRPYNWARVLRHEYVHIVNLEQTQFRIPHWFTEALAVRNEGVDYPANWEPLLAKFVHDDSLFNLSNINHGFTRPGSSDRWTLAYFQAYLYADYIASLRGEEALNTMLGLYREGATTDRVLREIVQMPRDEFEADYKKFIRARVAAFLKSLPSKVATDELEESLDENPDDVEAMTRLAVQRVRDGKLRDARRWAEKILAKDKNNSAANGVMAKLLFSVGEDKSAWSYLDAGLAGKEPTADLIAMAANRKLADKEYAAAQKYFELGQATHPKDPKWNRGLARVFLATQNHAKLIPVLGEIADRDPDKISMAQKLAKLALDQKDYSATKKWANRVIQIDVLNPLAHAQLAAAYEGLGKKEKAIREYEAALKLLPNELAWKKRLDELKQGQ